MPKTVLLVPGFTEIYTDRDYDLVIKTIKSKGYDCIFVPITWKRTTILNWLEDLEKVYGQYDPKDVILAGFSFGAVTAFCESAKNSPSQLWLFSLSPYFDEDLKIIKEKYTKLIGKKRINVFEKLDFDFLASKITCLTKIFFGSIEAKKYPTLKTRAIKANKLIKNSELYEIKNTDHKLDDPNYLKAISINI